MPLAPVLIGVLIALRCARGRAPVYTATSVSHCWSIPRLAYGLEALASARSRYPPASPIVSQVEIRAICPLGSNRGGLCRFEGRPPPLRQGFSCRAAVPKSPAVAQLPLLHSDRA